MLSPSSLKMKKLRNKIIWLKIEYTETHSPVQLEKSDIHQVLCTQYVPLGKSPVQLGLKRNLVSQRVSCLSPPYGPQRPSALALVPSSWPSEAFLPKMTCTEFILTPWLLTLPEPGLRWRDWAEACLLQRALHTHHHQPHCGGPHPPSSPPSFLLQ